jgi:hypothetical protein
VKQRASAGRGRLTHGGGTPGALTMVDGSRYTALVPSKKGGIGIGVPFDPYDASRRFIP